MLIYVHGSIQNGDGAFFIHVVNLFFKKAMLHLFHLFVVIQYQTTNSLSTL